MRLSCSKLLRLMVVVTAALSLAGATSAAPPDDKKSDSEAAPKPTVEAARNQAKLAHGIYAATLDVIHDRFFHEDKSAIPARVMEDVFAKLGRETNVKARWISVNANPMRIEHEPQDAFEKEAARVIASGKKELERVEDGVYRRAAGISLMNRGCLKCHLPVGASGRIERFAGLVIAIPVADKE